MQMTKGEGFVTDLGGGLDIYGYNKLDFESRLGLNILRKPVA